MKEVEFVCLKALAFLHPEARGLSQHAQQLIRETRNKILKGFFHKKNFLLKKSSLFKYFGI
jgi:hypothetical protein